MFVLLYRQKGAIEGFKESWNIKIVEYHAWDTEIEENNDYFIPSILTLIFHLRHLDPL